MTAGEDVFGLVGQVVGGKYRIERVLGEGGFGVVYAGVQTLIGQPVAIKCLKLPGDASAQRAMSDAFLREARVLFELGHPAIVRMYDAGELPTKLGTVLYVALELVEGTPLDREIERRRQGARPPFSAAEIRQVMTSLLEALAFAHARGVCHRDLKPANVIVREADGALSCKIVDFGTARVASAAPLHTGPAPGLTPRYAAPEQWDASFGSTGPATDLFAAGLVLEEMATLSFAIEGDALPKILAAAMSANRVSRVAERRPELAALAPVATRATALQPHARFASATEMRAALEAALDRASADASFAPAGPHVSPYAVTTGAPLLAVPRVAEGRGRGAALAWVLGAVAVGALVIAAAAVAVAFRALRKQEAERAIAPPAPSASPVSVGSAQAGGSGEAPRGGPPPVASAEPAPVRPAPQRTARPAEPKPPTGPRPPTEPKPSEKKLVFYGSTAAHAGLEPHTAAFEDVARRGLPTLEVCFRELALTESWLMTVRVIARPSAGSRHGLGLSIVRREGVPDASNTAARLRDCVDNRVAMWPWPREEIKGVSGGSGYLNLTVGLIWKP